MTDYAAFYTNQSDLDPTRTLTLRSRWVADWNRRIKSLKAVINKAVVEDDVFGLKEREHFALQVDLQSPGSRKFAYRWSHEKVSAFMD